MAISRTSQNMTNPDYAAAFVRDWLAIGTPRAKQFIINAARRQRANLETAKHLSQTINLEWCDLEQYEASVQILENAAQQIQQETA